MNEKLKGLHEAIKIQESIMATSQTRIREAKVIFDEMELAYKRAMEEKIYLQSAMVDELLKESENNKK